MSSMEPTDEMVEAACAAFLVPSDEAARWPCDYDEEEQAAFRSYMRASITAALAVMPDQHRAGWIAGRDAAASYVDFNVTDSGRVFAQSIRNMEPPA